MFTDTRDTDTQSTKDTQPLTHSELWYTLLQYISIYLPAKRGGLAITIQITTLHHTNTGPLCIFMITCIMTHLTAYLAPI